MTAAPMTATPSATDEQIDRANATGRTPVVFEELGSEVLVYFAVNAPGPKGGSVAAVVAGEELESAPLIAGSGTVFCATFEPRSSVRIGDAVEATVDANRLHFFDPETDAAL